MKMSLTGGPLSAGSTYDRVPISSHTKGFNSTAHFVQPLSKLPSERRIPLPMQSIHIRSGEVMVKVGQPIASKELKLSDREALTQKPYEEMRGMLEEGDERDGAAAAG